tara:strand:+ start:623 stop:751 length:129 start_codon:yes stop_codon:yes gene_type:complete
MASKAEKKGMWKGAGVLFAVAVFMSEQFDSARASIKKMLGGI